MFHIPFYIFFRNDPSAVLDFLIALTCNPKLLQGREKYSPKHGAAEDILGLPIPQVNYTLTVVLRLNSTSGLFKTRITIPLLAGS